MFPRISATVIAFAALAGACNAQQQPNSASASMKINGRAADGYGGTTAQDLIPGSGVTLTISGAPWKPVLLVMGSAIDPGLSVAPYGLQNVSVGEILLNGFSPGGFGFFATTGSTGSLSLNANLALNAPIGMDFAFQAAVATSQPPGILLTAPEVIRPDRAKIAYTSPQESSHVELFGSNRFGTANVKCNKPLVYFGQVTKFAWSPDGTKVAYLSDENYGTLNELAVTNGDGTGHHRVNGNLIPVGDVVDFAWSPDSSKLAYLADQDNDEIYELWTVNADGTGLTKVSGSMFALGDVYEFLWSPDSSRIAFRADPTNDYVFGLYVALADGSGLALVAPSIAPSYEFAWSPAGGSLALIQYDINNKRRLAVVTQDGSGSTVIGESSGSAGVYNFTWAPDGSRIGFREVSYYGGLTPQDKVEVFTVQPNGAGKVRVSSDIQPTYAGVTAFRWSPDSTRVAYRSDQQFYQRFELYANSATPGVPNSAVQINAFLTPNGNIKDGGWAWSSDSTKLAYIADQFIDGVDELFTSNANGTGNTKVSGTLPANGTVYDFTWSPAGPPRLAYLAEQDGLSGVELYRVNGNGTGAVRLSSPAPNIDSADVYAWNPDGTRVLFRSYGTTIFANNEAGTDLVRISPTSYYISAVAWSPVP